MVKKRKLSDLYVVQKDVIIDDGSGEVTVTVKKLSPIQHETVLRRANAKRAKYLAISKQGVESEEKNAVLNEVFDAMPDREDLIEFLVADHVTRVYEAREAEVSAEEEWSENDYIQGLKDSWVEEMYDRFVSDPEDEEAAHVKAELDRFTEDVNKALEGERRSARRDFETYDDEKLIDKALDKFLQAQADMEWLGEYRRSEIWQGVRDPDTGEQYFESRSEVDDLSVEVLAALMEGFRSLNVDSVEGKD